MRDPANSMNTALDLRETYRGPDLKLFIRDVRDRQERKRSIKIRSWSSIKDVKHIIQRELHIPPSAQRLYFGPLMTSGGELPNHRSLHDAGIYRSGETILMDIKGGSVDSISSPNSASLSTLRSLATADICVSSSMVDSCPRQLRRIVQQARRGLALGLKPALALDGSGGTYFLHDARKVRVATFKPSDEEPYAENNPRGYLKQVLSSARSREQGQLALREGIAPGEACIREVAAYLLDHDGFSGVPMTTLAEACHPTAFNTNGSMLKLSEGGASVGAHSLNPLSPATPTTQTKAGSFQEYVNAECTMDDLSMSKISVEEVHKIAILDIRIMNGDRNAANLLCRRRRDNSIELVPIDHGYCLRSVCDVSWMDWCWLDWPQMKEPLSNKHKKFILKLDIDADARLLKERLNLDTKAIDFFRASSRLLQAGVKAGLSLYDIAVMCCRNDDAGVVPSKLEVLTSMASELATRAAENGRWHHSAASRALEDQLSPGGGSLLVSPQVKESPVIFKSASTENILSLGRDGLRRHDSVNRPPGMANSSVSDSSTDTEDPTTEREECDEWAAGIVADVQLDSSMSRLGIKTRSPSIESADSLELNLSCSPKGFWTVRPGSERNEDCESDSLNSSPRGSPTDGLILQSMQAQERQKRGRSVTFADAEASYLSPTGTFADPFPGDLIVPQAPSTVSVETFKKSTVGDPSGPPSLSDAKPSSLARSQSYGAFSAHRSSSVCSSSSSEVMVNSANADQYRGYFLKFVDLVITRETAAASVQGQV